MGLLDNLFKFANRWREKLIDEPLDARMAETLKVGLTIARAEVHKVTWELHDSIGGEYDKSTKTIKLHADKPYALIEETRSPTGAHSYLAPAANEMARLWGGNFELHYPSAAVGRHPMGPGRLRQREERIYQGLAGAQLRGVASRTRIFSRRWHRRYGPIPSDPTTPIL